GANLDGAVLAKSDFEGASFEGASLIGTDLRDVKLRVFIQPERKAQAERHADATAAALFFYGMWFGEYPYQEITVVDPAWGDNNDAVFLRPLALLVVLRPS
ncbi:MAG TPA: hypothetical protein EYQ32_11055, partial [Gammaproteobacteria bacterium]|nr:hypothetical protein [Gammaproteobacteria bacterium]